MVSSVWFGFGERPIQRRDEAFQLLRKPKLFDRLVFPRKCCSVLMCDIDVEPFESIDLVLR